MEKVAFMRSPRMRGAFRGSPEAVDREVGCLNEHLSISVVCLWVRKDPSLLLIILNNSKSGGYGKPTPNSFQKDVERRRQRENTSENKFIFLAQRQRTGAWSRAIKTDPSKPEPVFQDIQVK